jgi:hypothetical protein
MCYYIPMKRLLPLIFFLVLCGYCFAEEPDYDESEKPIKNIFGFDSGILATDISYGTGNTFALKFNANLADFYFENIKTGLGAEFFPVNYSYSLSANEHILSFSKLYLIWNMDKVMGIYFDGKKYASNGKRTLGPFVAIQTLNLVNFENFNTNISYSAGIKLAYKDYTLLTKKGIMPMTFCSGNVELGYNYSYNRHSIYFTIGLSPLYTFIFPFGYIYLSTSGFMSLN